MLMPPAAEAVPENRASPIDALAVTMLWCTLVFRLKPYPICRLVMSDSTSVTGSPGGGGLAPPTVNGSGNSPLPMLMPPVSVPWLARTRVFETSRLWFQPCAQIAPPPCELLITLIPSTRDGLHRKLPVQSAVLFVRYSYPAGKAPSPVVPQKSELAAGMRMPRPSTVTPAPSYAPI